MSTSTGRSTVARRGRGGRGAGLTPEQIVEQAVALLRAGATRALRLRRLAWARGVEAPAR
jgi:hypothetical protein